MRPAHFLSCLAFLLFPLVASAEDAAESVTVMGQTRAQLLRSFIRATVAPSYLDGKLSRWNVPVCPLVIGLAPQENAAVKVRISKDIVAAGAVLAKETCRPNVTVAFAPNPQELMTRIVDDARLNAQIGDNDGAMHRAKKSKVVAPVQAWYGTITTGVDGFRGLPISPYPDLKEYCLNAPCYKFQASRLDDGLQSNLANVFVVVDLAKVGGLRAETLADYAAMLALSETYNFTACRPLPSITNLLAADCDARLKVSALSDADLALLRGVYKAQVGDVMNLALGDVLREMVKSKAAPDDKEPAQSSAPAPSSTAK